MEEYRNRLLVHVISNKYGEEWYVYDNKGKLIQGYEIRSTYNENGDCILLKDPNARVEKFEYDEDGRVIHHKSSIAGRMKNEN